MRTDLLLFLSLSLSLSLSLAYSISLAVYLFYAYIYRHIKVATDRELPNLYFKFKIKKKEGVSERLSTEEYCLMRALGPFK
jgi:hypothetical protein